MSIQENYRKEREALFEKERQEKVKTRIKALLYTEGEGQHLKICPFVLYKDDFNPEIYKIKKHLSYSNALQSDTNNNVLLIEGTPVFALFFWDGSTYETGRGWREDFPSTDTFIQRIYAEKILKEQLNDLKSAPKEV